MQSEQAKIHIFIPRLKFLFKQICRNFMHKKYLDVSTINLINLDENHLSDDELYCGTEV